MNEPRPGSTMGRVRSSRLPLLIGLVVFGVSLVVLGALAAVGLRIGDALARDVEMDVLVHQIEVSERAMTAVQEDEAQALARFQAGEIAAPQLRDRLRDIARTGGAEIAAAGERVAAVPWLRWHADVRAAQQAYLAHSRAWVEYLKRAAEDPEEFGRPQEDVNDTFTRLREPLLAAVPRWDPLRVRDRAERLFAPGSPGPPGSQA